MNYVKKTLACWHKGFGSRVHYTATLSNLDGPMTINVQMWAPAVPSDSYERHTSSAHTWDELTNLDHEDRIQRTLLLEGSPFAADIHFDRITPLIKGLLGPAVVTP